ncbi:MAG: Ig-like domain-containing protein [Anaerolineales bacterium]
MKSNQVNNLSQSRARVGATALLAAATLTTILWFAAAAGAAPIADCSSGNFFGVYQTNDVTLSGDLFVTSGVTIRNNVTLTITAGSNVTLCGAYKIQVSGGADLVARGTAAQPITFSADNPATNWDSISFANQGEYSILQYVTLNDGGGNDPNADNGAIKVNNNSGTTALPSPAIDNVTINDSGAYGISLSMLPSDPTPPSITNVTINNSANAAILADAEALGGLGSGNSYTSNQPNVIQIRGGGGSHLKYSQYWRNPGVPIEVLGDFSVSAETTDPPAVLTIDPGLTFLMYPQTDVLIGSSFGRRGSLVINGTAAEPVTFTRLDEFSAPWGHLRASLYSDTAVSLDYVNFSYGGDSVVGTIYQLGSGAVNLDYVSVQNSLSAGFYGGGGGGNGQATINNSSFELNDTGLEFLSGFSAIIRNSTIANNVTAGVSTTDNGNNTCIDAIGNFWGANNGPADSDGGNDACGNGRTNSGSGSNVSNGVLYDPWLPGSGSLQDRGRIVADKFYIITDGVDAAQVEITLRDAQGNPLSGKQVQLRATVGSVQQPSGVTDSNGRVTAVVTGTNPGYAYLTAYNVTDDTPVAGIGGVTFWQGNSDAGGLISADGTPYASPDLIITGKPYQVGFPVGMSIPMRNGNTYPVDVTVVYEVSNLNIGASFTPVYTAAQTLQPGESWDASGVWLPTKTGHLCILASITVDDGQSLQSAQAATTTTSLQQNTNQDPCNPDALNPSQALPKTPGGLFKVAHTFYKLYNLAKKANQCLSESLQFARFGVGGARDYQVVVTPPTYSPPLITADSEITQAQADALNNLAGTTAELLSLNLAMGATSQRMNWASQASTVSIGGGSGGRAAVNSNPFFYLDLQYQAYRGFGNQYADKLDEFANEIDALLAVSPGADTTYYLPVDFQTTRDEIASTGFDTETKTFYQQTGLSTELISQLETDLVADYDRSPFEIISWSWALGNIQTDARAIASRLRGTYPSLGRSTNGVNSVVVNSVFVRPLPFTFDVGHPFNNTRDVELVVRPLNLPLDWTYELSSPFFTLAATEVATATLTLYPGSEMLEGDLVQVAVEGYVDGELVGGIIMEHNTPSLTPRAASYDVYLPVVLRQ